MIRINQLKLPVRHTEQALEDKIKKLLQLKHVEQSSGPVAYTYEIVRKSMDARKKPELFYVYSVNITVQQAGMQHSSAIEKMILKRVNNNDIMLIDEKKYDVQKWITGRTFQQNVVSPVVVGSGPAGLFCAYLLAQAGCKPIVLERGEAVEDRRNAVEGFWNGERRLDPNSNVQFGEGGAGTFSDGKLNTLVKDSMGRNRYVLETFVKFGAKQEILYDSKPHLGTDELFEIVHHMREAILAQGGTFRFHTCLTDLCIQDGNICGIRTRDCHTGLEEQLEAKQVILAIGHSARDTFYMLQKKNVDMQAKPFAVGLRMEHPQAWVNECQYGIQTEPLPAADYKLTNQASNGRSVYSFCMCPGGYVVNASSEEGRLAVNGMSYSARDGRNANSALIVSVTPADFGSEDALAGIAFQRKLEEKAFQLGNGKIPAQRYEDFRKNRKGEIGHAELMPCMKGNFENANLRELFPSEINDALLESIEKFGHTMIGYNRPDAILSGVESRTSSPVRIVRDKTGQGSIGGLYPCGEGAGYAGGITSAAMDGMKTAEHILEEYEIG